MANRAAVSLLSPRVAHLLGIGENLSERRDSITRGINDIYDFHRKETLESHYWSFAEELAIIQRAADRPAFGYAYYSPLPLDFIGLTYMNFSGERNLGCLGVYQIFGNRMATNSTPVFISYTRDVDDISIFSPLFVKALAYSIAMELSLSLVGDKDLGDRLERMRSSIKFESIEVDYRNQGTRETLQGQDVLESHFGPGSFDAEDNNVTVPTSPLPGLVTPDSEEDEQGG